MNRPFNRVDAVRLRTFELFAGSGGLALGFHQSGFQHSGFLEYNKNACKTLKINFGEDRVHHTDIREFDFSSIQETDIITGGPPCQPFSLGGKHNGNLDTRDMFPYACKAISTHLPKVFVFENVKGLLRKSFRPYLDYIVSRLRFPEITKDEGESWLEHAKRIEALSTKYDGVRYSVTLRLVNAANYGVPQQRERIIIVGIRGDLDLNWEFPDETHSLESLLYAQYVDNSYWERHGIPIPQSEEYLQIKKRYSSAIRKVSGPLFQPTMKPWVTVRDALQELPPPDELGSHHPEHILIRGAKSYPGHTGSYIDQPSKAIKAGVHGVPGGENMILYHGGAIRYYSTFEAKRIQTYPDEYRIHGSWAESMRQIGNAVPVLLANRIADSIRWALTNS